MMQRLYKEKEFIKKEIKDYDNYFNKVYDESNYKFGQTLRRYYNCVEDLPKSVLNRSK